MDNPSKTGLLDETSLAIESGFKLDQLSMKSDCEWHLKILVASRLPRVYDGYKVLFKFDNGPYDRRAEALDRRLKLAQENPSFEGMNNPEEDVVKGEIDENEATRVSLSEKCKDIEFRATVEAMKYTDRGETLLTMIIPAESIGELNEQRMLLRHYCVVLDHPSAE